MVSAHLPCMVFSADSCLCDEKSILTVCEDILTLKELEKRFIRSLYDDYEDFLSFCAADVNEDYRFYRIRSFSEFGGFRYAFCEKAKILGDIFTVVYLSHNVCDFHPLMSPSSGILRGTADILTSELIEIKCSAEAGKTRLSAEAFSVASRIPNLCEAIFEPRERARYCDLFAVTEFALGKICSFPGFSASAEIKVKRGTFSGGTLADGIIEIPVEAYTAVLTVLLSAAASLSSTHSLNVTVSYYAHAADIEIITPTDKLTERIILASVRCLESAGIRTDFLRIAETIAYIAGIDLSVSFDERNGILKTVIGLGYDMQSIPDFKYNDPLEFIEAVADEVTRLLSSI